MLAFIPFLAGLVPVIWRAGQEALAVAVATSGGVFVAMGFVSRLSHYAAAEAQALCTAVICSRVG